MSKAQPRRLHRRLFTLSLLLLCLAFLTSAPGARADEDCCIYQFNSCNAQCSSYSCESACWAQYASCSAPGGGGGCYIPPEEPCPGCAESCDVMQQECIDSGGDPRSCVSAGVRCRQSCYVGCPH